MFFTSPKAETGGFYLRFVNFSTQNVSRNCKVDRARSVYLKQKKEQDTAGYGKGFIRDAGSDVD
ncbi:hypothetical protein CMK14_02735, partial [Candidatus Poribacteria bacterium]|nr:hypothetical protein [Candidatus Poribacteria bacterium]